VHSKNIKTNESRQQPFEKKSFFTEIKKNDISPFRYSSKIIYIQNALRLNFLIVRSAPILKPEYNLRREKGNRK